MNKNDNKTKSTEIVGGSDYKGYNSVGFSSYDEINDSDKEKAKSLGGIFDNDAKSYGKNRFKFKTKEQRDKFNNYLEKKKNKENKKLDEQKIIREELFRIVEDFKSNILRDTANAHGGIKNSSSWTNGGWDYVPLDQVTDDMFDSTEVNQDMNTTNNGIAFNDGTYLPFADASTEGGNRVRSIANDIKTKMQQRRSSGYRDGSEEYQSPTVGSRHARDVRGSMAMGHNSMKYGQQMHDSNPSDYKSWNKYVRDAETMYGNAKKAYNQGKEKGDFNNKKPNY